MTSLFDGVSGLISGVFGAPVTLTSQTGAVRIIEAVIRNSPVELMGEDGRGVLDVAPQMRVVAWVAAGIEVGDHVETASGVRYRVLHRQPSGSPATDAMTLFGLEVLP